jgi:cellulose biosynthesis protein BcsQ
VALTPRNLAAADLVVIPVCGDAFSLKGLELTLHEITSICDTFQLEPPVIKILYTKFDKRVKITFDIFERLASAYKNFLIPASSSLALTCPSMS